MDEGEIFRVAFIISLILIALPFPIAILATGLVMALAGFIAVESLLDFTWKSLQDRNGAPHPGG